jgi:hypothetical protein
LAYLAGVLWIFANGVKISSSGSPLSRGLRPVLVGSACFLLGNATNAYLGKFDYLWVLFLPVAYVNLWLLSRRPSNIIHLAPLNATWSRLRSMAVRDPSVGDCNSRENEQSARHEHG